MANSAPLKTSPGAQDMKTGRGAFGTAENESAQKDMKTGRGAFGTAENKSGSIKH
jgi:trimethylamine:corrinoid methyltransferase-like protein